MGSRIVRARELFYCPQQIGPPQTTTISTQSHRRQEWALIIAQRTEGPNGQFSISANGIPGDSINFADSFPSHPSAEYVLELGGFTGEPRVAFLRESGRNNHLQRRLWGRQISYYALSHREAPALSDSRPIGVRRKGPARLLIDIAVRSHATAGLGSSMLTAMENDSSSRPMICWQHFFRWRETR